MEKKEYKFWGWENADVSPITDEYKGIIKTEARNGELKSAGSQAIEAALRIGAKAIRIKHINI